MQTVPPEGAVCESEDVVECLGCESSRSEAETYCDLDMLRCVDGCQVDDHSDASKGVLVVVVPVVVLETISVALEVCDLESSACDGGRATL